MNCDSCGADITHEGVADMIKGGKWCSWKCSQVQQLDLLEMTQ